MVSTGKSQKVEQDQKTTFFGEFTVALPVIWVPTGPRDIECGLVFDHKSLSTGNRHIRYFLGLVKGPVGSYGVPRSNNHNNNLHKSAVFPMANTTLGSGD